MRHLQRLPPHQSIATIRGQGRNVWQDIAEMLYSVGWGIHTVSSLNSHLQNGQGMLWHNLLLPGPPCSPPINLHAHSTPLLLSSPPRINTSHLNYWATFTQPERTSTHEFRSDHAHQSPCRPHTSHPSLHTPHLCSSACTAPWWFSWRLPPSPNPGSPPAPGA